MIFAFEADETVWTLPGASVNIKFYNISCCLRGS